jgi:hypothetical protein
VGIEYSVYLPDVGTQVFLCFEDDEEVQMERLADVGIEKEEEDEEEGNYLRKEHVPYRVNFKESVP